MDEKDFQNVVYPCCGLVKIHNGRFNIKDAYAGAVEAGIIEALAQKCKRCGAFCRGIIQLVQHYKKHYRAANIQVCVLCCNPYITKAALDCHLTLNSGGIN